MKLPLSHLFQLEYLVKKKPNKQKIALYNANNNYKQFMLEKIMLQSPNVVKYCKIFQYKATEAIVRGDFTVGGLSVLRVVIV